MFARRSDSHAIHFILRRHWQIGCCCIALGGILTSACTRSANRTGNPPASVTGTANSNPYAMTPATGAASGERLGTVHVIGTGRRFVLVETPTFLPSSALVDGQALVSRSGGAVTSSLRVSHERRPPFVVADVTNGEPHLGDEVFTDPSQGRTTGSAAGVSAPLLPPGSPSPAATPDFRTEASLPPAR